MKLDIFDLGNNKIGEVQLPNQFDEELRQDLIHRTVLAIQSHNRQPYSSSPMAGKRSSAKLSRRRRDYRGSYGLGISRVPRKIMTRRGTRMNWVGAFAPGTVGGRRAHPPKTEKIWWKKINEKERLKAIRSAIAATASKEIITKRGHLIPSNYPFILDEKLEHLEKTKDVVQTLEKLGFNNELARIEDRKIRAGKGKSRGRKYIIRKGPLIVVSKPGKLLKSAINIAGVDVVDVRKLNAELLAPGGIPGRLTLWTTSAIETIKKENLFM